MHMGMVATQRLVPETMTSSVFRTSEQWLKVSDHMKALKFIQEPDEEFRSVLDWVFCEVFPHERSGCLKFYKDQGPALRDVKTKTELKLMDRCILSVLKVCYERFVIHQRIEWSRARRHGIKKFLLSV